jgi:hypothetical protein
MSHLRDLFVDIDACEYPLCVVCFVIFDKL